MSDFFTIRDKLGHLFGGGNCQNLFNVIVLEKVKKIFTSLFFPTILHKVVLDVLLILFLSNHYTGGCKVILKFCYSLF